MTNKKTGKTKSFNDRTYKELRASGNINNWTKKTQQKFSERVKDKGATSYVVKDGKKYNAETYTPEAKKKSTIELKEPIRVNPPTAVDKASALFTNPIESLTKGTEAGYEKQLTQGVGENIARSLGTGAVVGAATGATFSYALGSSAATTASMTAGEVSTLGYTRFAGQASKLIPGKLVTVPTSLKPWETAARFATNSKTVGLTKSMLLKKGLQGSLVAFIVGMFGSYPMAAWAKQEVEGGLKINARDAREEGDFETAEKMIALREEMHKVDWHDFTPYENVFEKFRKFTEADKLAVESEKRLIAKERGEIEFEGQSQGEQIAARDEEQSQKFANIEEQKRQGQEEDEQKFADIEAANKEKDLEEMRWKAAYYALIREGNFEEAEELLNSQ